MDKRWGSYSLQVWRVTDSNWFWCAASSHPFSLIAGCDVSAWRVLSCCLAVVLLEQRRFFSSSRQTQPCPFQRASAGLSLSKEARLVNLGKKQKAVWPGFCMGFCLLVNMKRHACKIFFCISFWIKQTVSFLRSCVCRNQATACGNRCVIWCDRCRI